MGDENKINILRQLFFFSEDSSKELEELRSAFARAVEYLKQEVEERKLIIQHIVFSCSK